MIRLDLNVGARGNTQAGDEIPGDVVVFQVGCATDDADRRFIGRAGYRQAPQFNPV